MPNWDDEFDLDDYNPKKPPPKKPEKPKKKEEDYFDLDEPEEAPNKLPAITPKNAKQSSKSKNNYDFDELEDEVEEVKSPPKPQQIKPSQKSKAY